MGLNFTITSGDQAQTATPAVIPCVVACCTAVSSGVYQFDAGQDVSATLGGGLGADIVYAILRQPGVTRVLFSACAQTWTAAPSVSQTGSGPTVTLSLDSGASGCFDDHKLLIAVKNDGANGVAQIGIAYDGVTELDVLPVPVEQPAVLRGTVPITAAILAQVATLHFDFTAPSSATLTFPVGSLGVAAAGIMAATATITGGHTYTSSSYLTGAVAALAANPRRIRFTSAGTDPTHVPASISVTGTDYTGAAQSETVTPSTSSGGHVTTAKAYASFSWSYASAGGTDATIAVGYEDAYASADEVAAQINTLATSASLAVRARVADTASGLLLEFYTATIGGSATATIDDMASTADTLFGFASGSSNLTATGAAAKLSLPWTGLVATFASGTYKKGTTYTAACTGPRPSLSAELAAMTAAHDAYADKPFGFFALVHPSTTGSNAAARQAAVSTQLATWQADTTAPLPFYAGVAATMHTPSATLATNDANVAAADADLLTGFAGSTVALDSVIPGDVYLAGSSALRAGTYRRPAAVAWAMRRAGVAKLADDVGSDDLAEGSLLSPDGVTRARDESRASTKLGSGNGPGFSVLGATAAGLRAPRFAPGATRAGSSSRLRYAGVVAVAKEIARLARPVVSGWIGKVFPTDPSTKQLLDGEKATRANEIKAAIDDTLFTGEAKNEPYNVSARNVQILDPLTGTYLDNGIIRVRVPFVPLGETEQVFVEISAVGTIISNG